MKNTKFILLPVILAVVVVSGVAFFSFDNIENPNTMEEYIDNSNTSTDEKYQDNLFVNDSVSIEKNFIDENTQREPVTYYGSSNGEPNFAIYEVSLSEMPLVNQTVTFTAKSLNSYDDDDDYNYLSTYLYDGWEFVNIPKDKIFNGTTSYERDYLYVHNYYTLDYGEIETFTFQIKPTSLGPHTIEVFREGEESSGISLFIGTDRTIPLEQYWEENPELAPWNNIPEREPCVYEDCEPVFPDESNLSTGGDTSYEPTPEEIEMMKKLGVWPPINGTSGISSESGASGASSTITIHGFIKNQPSHYSEPSNIYISDVNVCAWDYDSIGSMQKLGCAYTNHNGYFSIPGLSNTDEDNTTLDVYFTYSTNSQYSSIQDVMGNYYQDISTTNFNISNSSNYFYNYRVDSTGTLEETKYHRVFAITDAIGDARLYFSDNNLDVDKVNVKWQHDRLSNIFTPGNDPGAYYIGDPINTIYLDGLFSSSTTNFDDSEQRYTILHEWGHHQMNNAFVDWPVRCDGDHFITQPNNEGCAWIEGWADFLPYLLDNTPSYTIDPVQSFNVETLEYISHTNMHIFNNTLNGNDIGHTVEGHIAGALWDIYDGVGTGTYDKRDNINKDTVNLGVDEILSVFAKEDLTMNGFYDQWKLDYPTTNNIDDIMYLHYMGFLTSSPVVPITDGNSITVYDDFESTLAKWTLTSDDDEDWEIVLNGTSTTAGDNHVISSMDCDRECILFLM